MAVQPFTPDGVQNKQAELYELSDIDLQTQADLIKDELRTWVTDNFSLTEDQVSYLNNMDEAYISYTAYEVSLAVANRLAVFLTQTGDPASGKLVHTTG